MTRPNLILATCAALTVGGCQPASDAPAHVAEVTSDTAPTTTDRVAIPPLVRRNLGITFAPVELRDVARTIRVPGSFELSPEARREYRAMASGRVELHVAQYDEIVPEQPVYTLDSPDWRALQQQLNESELQIEQTRASAGAMGPLLAAHAEHHIELERAVVIWAQRLDQLEASRATGVVTDAEIAQARGTLASTRANHAEVLEKEAELHLREAQVGAELRAHRQRFELLLANAGSLLSLPVATLLEIDPSSPSGHPRWREIRRIAVHAETAGVVESVAVTNGAWIDAGDMVLTTVQPDQLRFRAMGLQADLPRLAAGTSARVAPPRSPNVAIGDAVKADLQIGLDAHPDNRTIALIARPTELRSWMRPGVSAFLEIVIAGSDGPALAIPRSAIVKDGLAHVFFRRDPLDPDQALRIEADMGVTDGRWVAIHSGLMRGDTVVLDGVYELKLATMQNGAAQRGGHFHADGSFHGEK